MSVIYQTCKCRNGLRQLKEEQEWTDPVPTIAVKMIVLHSDWRRNYTFTDSKVITVSTLAIVYTLLNLFGIAAYISLGKRNYISGRMNKMALCQTLGGFIVGIYQFYGILVLLNVDYGAKYSVCAVQLWALHFAAILYFIPVICNCIRVLYITKMGTEVLKGYAQEETKLFTTTSGSILYLLLNTVHYKKNVKYPELKKVEFPLWMNNNLEKYQLIYRMDDLFFLLTLILGLVMLVVGGFIQAFGVSHRVMPVLDVNNCVAGKDIYFMYTIILGIALIITPIAVFTVRGVKDNYDIVSEALYICGINIWFIIMYIFWTATVYPQFPKIYDSFPAQGWIIIMTIFTLFISILLPIKRAYSKSKILLYDREKFNKMLLTQPEEWDQFEAAVIADFKFPLLVFELHMQELLENIYYPASNNNIMSDNYVKGQTYIKYSEVIRIYFCPDSPFCLPLSKSWLDEIQQKLATGKVTVGIFDETRNYINDSLFVNTYCSIPEFRIVKENSGEFLFSRYLSRLQPKSSKILKEVKPSKTPIVRSITTDRSPTDYGFRPESAESVLSPYSTNLTDVPSPVTAHGSFSKLYDPEKQAHRKSSELNRRSFYPMGIRNSVQVDSLIMPKNENVPSAQTFSDDDDDDLPILSARDSIQKESLTKNTSILETSRSATHMMDNNSFTAVTINTTDSQHVQTVDSLIKKYKVESLDASDNLDSMGYKTTYSGFYTEASEIDNESRAVSSYYQESTISGEQSKQKSSMISFVAPPISGDITDAKARSKSEPRIQSLKVSPLVKNPEDSVRQSHLSTGTRPYFVIEEGENEEE